MCSAAGGTHSRAQQGAAQDSSSPDACASAHSSGSAKIAVIQGVLGIAAATACHCAHTLCLHHAGTSCMVHALHRLAHPAVPTGRLHSGIVQTRCVPQGAGMACSPREPGPMLFGHVECGGTVDWLGPSHKRCCCMSDWHAPVAKQPRFLFTTVLYSFGGVGTATWCVSRPMLHTVSASMLPLAANACLNAGLPSCAAVPAVLPHNLRRGLVQQAQRQAAAPFFLTDSCMPGSGQCTVLSLLCRVLHSVTLKAAGALPLVVLTCYCNCQILKTMIVVSVQALHTHKQKSTHTDTP